MRGGVDRVETVREPYGDHRDHATTDIPDLPLRLQDACHPPPNVLRRLLTPRGALKYTATDSSSQAGDSDASSGAGVSRRNTPLKPVLNHMLDITGSRWRGARLGIVTRLCGKNPSTLDAWHLSTANRARRTHQAWQTKHKGGERGPTVWPLWIVMRFAIRGVCARHSVCSGGSCTGDVGDTAAVLWRRTNEHPAVAPRARAVRRDASRKSSSRQRRWRVSTPYSGQPRSGRATM